MILNLQYKITLLIILKPLKENTRLVNILNETQTFYPKCFVLTYILALFQKYKNQLDFLDLFFKKTKRRLGCNFF